jgi:hypothetical protein
LPGVWLAAGLGLSLVALALLLMMARLTINPFTPGNIAICAGGTALLAIRFACRHASARWQHQARDFSEYAGLFVAVCLIGAIASYPIAAANHGFADAHLEAIDRRLGFNWVGWYEFVAAHPWLQMVSRGVYQSIFVTPAIVLGYLAYNGRRAEARLFITSFWLGALLTLSLFSLMPAEGPLAFLWHSPIPYMPISALYQAELIPALRDHAVHTIDPGTLHGLVCAPSFHAASAILYIAAAWRCGPLRWPILAVNCAMLLATPVEGTHYLADIIAGVIVALIAIGGGSALQGFAGSRSIRAEERNRQPVLVI